VHQIGLVPQTPQLAIDKNQQNLLFPRVHQIGLVPHQTSNNGLQNQRDLTVCLPCQVAQDQSGGPPDLATCPARLASHWSLNPEVFLRPDWFGAHRTGLVPHSPSSSLCPPL
jgi:hypothetical protein